MEIKIGVIIVRRGCVDKCVLTVGRRGIGRGERERFGLLERQITSGKRKL